MSFMIAGFETLSHILLIKEYIFTNKATIPDSEDSLLILASPKGFLHRTSLSHEVVD